MSKIALMLFAGLLSVSAHATGLEIFFAPREPAVLTSDFDMGNGEIVKGPWFQNQMSFNTDMEAYITGLQVTATSMEGRSIDYEINFPQALHVVPGVTALTPILYFGTLPKSNSFTYDVEVHVNGSFVDKSGDPADAIDLVGSFRTQ